MTMLHSVYDGDETLQVCPWGWDGQACKVSSPSDTECVIGYAKIPIFYAGNPHDCYAKKRDMGDDNATFGVRWG